MINASRLSDLAECSLCFSTEHISLRMEDSTEEVDQTKLVVAGTPEGFRWLARQLEQMAKTAEECRVPLLRSICAAYHSGRTEAKRERKLGREAALRSARGEGHNPDTTA